MIYRIPHKPTDKTNLKRTVFEPPKFGIECMFIKMSRTKGIKVYETKKEALFARKLQMKAARNKLAPQVLSTIYKCHFDFHCDDKWGAFYHNQKYAYFFVTEVVEILKKISYPVAECLQKKLWNLGIHTYDVHPKNVGRIGERLVMVDFGRESISDDKEIADCN